MGEFSHVLATVSRLLCREEWPPGIKRRRAPLWVEMYIIDLLFDRFQIQSNQMISTFSHLHSFVSAYLVGTRLGFGGAHHQQQQDNQHQPPTLPQGRGCVAVLQIVLRAKQRQFITPHCDRFEWWRGYDMTGNIEINFLQQRPQSG